MTSWRTSTALILSLMVLTYAFVGAILGYALTYFFTGGDGWVYGAATFLVFALIVAAYSYLAPVDAVLKGLNARRTFDGRLCGIVEKIAKEAGSPVPAVYVLDVPFPNAFALGKRPDKALVAATAPLMDMLSDDELEGVMAHEMAHIIHRDTVVNSTARNSARFLSLSSVMMGFAGMFGLAAMGGGKGSSGGAGILLLLMLALLIPLIAVCLVFALALPSAGAVMRFGVSRSREYGADETAARITGRPLALASALVKLDGACASRSNAYKDASTANLWIVTPFGKNRRKLMFSLLDTHPSTEDRVRRLIALDKEINGGSSP